MKLIITTILALALTGCAGHIADWPESWGGVKEITVDGKAKKAHVGACHTLYAKDVSAEVDIGQGSGIAGNFQCCDKDGKCEPLPIFVVKPAPPSTSSRAIGGMGRVPADGLIIYLRKPADDDPMDGIIIGP